MPEADPRDPPDLTELAIALDVDYRSVVLVITADTPEQAEAIKESLDAQIKEGMIILDFGHKPHDTETEDTAA